MSDQEPTARELAEAEALARALDAPAASPLQAAGRDPAPRDALEVSGLLRYSRPAAELRPERRDKILERLLQASEPDEELPDVSAEQKHAAVRWLPWLGMATAAAAALALVLLRPFDSRVFAPAGSAPTPQAAEAPAMPEAVPAAAVEESRELAARPERVPIAERDVVATKRSAEESKPEALSARRGTVPVDRDEGSAADPTMLARKPTAHGSEASVPTSLSASKPVDLAPLAKGRPAGPAPEPIASAELGAKAETPVVKSAAARPALPRAVNMPGSTVDNSPETASPAPADSLTAAQPSAAEPAAPPPPAETVVVSPPLPAAPAHWPVPGSPLLAAQAQLAEERAWQHGELDRALAPYREGVFRAIAARAAKPQVGTPQTPRTP